VDEDYRAVNKANWDERGPAHAASPGYLVEELVRDPSRLSEVVSFDRPRLPDLTGLRVVHLQCHIGTDTLSLARLGASQVTGLDFSPQSLAQARKLAERAGTPITYVEADVYDAADLLGREQFDLVYTGVGALNWLPSVRRWAETVSALLAPGGRLHIREGHPVLWSLQDVREDRLLVIEYPYVETEQAQVWDEPGTYVETDVEFQQTRTMEWNHGLGDIVTALLSAGMRITMLVEHDSVPWCALPGAMERVGGDEWRLSDRPERLPHTYTLQAVKE
jgi:SAM-dependent methyltransferase